MADARDPGAPSARGVSTSLGQTYSGGLVLRSPVIRSPSFHWLRDLSSATRSNRFRTFLLAAVEPELRRLECCDMAKPL